MYQPEIGYRSPKTLSRMAMAGIGLVALCETLSGFVGIAQVINPGQSFSLEGEQSSLWLLIQGLIALVQFPTYVFSVVTFLMWLYRTYVNLPALGSDSTEFTPGWAVGWWFIPFANLVKPFQAVRNVWAESDPEVEPGMGFLSSVQPGAPTYMGFWWALWLLSNISANISSRFYDAEDQSLITVGGFAFIFSAILGIAAAALAIKVVADITDRQEQRFTKVGAFGQHGPPPPPTFSYGQQQ